MDLLVVTRRWSMHVIIPWWRLKTRQEARGQQTANRSILLQYICVFCSATAVKTWSCVCVLQVRHGVCTTTRSVSWEYYVSVFKTSWVRNNTNKFYPYDVNLISSYKTFNSLFIYTCHINLFNTHKTPLIETGPKASPTIWATLLALS